MEKIAQEVEKILMQNHIDYIPHKHFKWLGRQSVDFFLPQYHMGIECKGIQHFQMCDLEKANKTLQMELLKFYLCEENYINLIYVIYYI